MSKKHKNMERIRFNKDWTFKNDITGGDEIKVTLPHDAMQTEKRLQNMKNGAAAGFFPGGRYVYLKNFYAPHEWDGKCILIEFEGIYQNSSVYVNGKYIGGWIYGYTGFVLELSEQLNYGEDNEIRVIADNTRTPNSRWYTGSGIYRNVNLYVGNKNHIAVDGIQVTTKSIDPAVICVKTEIEATEDCDVTIKVYDGDTLVASSVGLNAKLTIKDAKLWSDESPHLYRVECNLVNNVGEVIDRQEIKTGIRLLAWSAEHGLEINNKSVKLRGGCIHHDNGILGSRAIDYAEERKVKILKDAGFNAIRSAHNPASKALLSACDKYGLYVMDEAFDQWQFMKVEDDYSIYFDEQHEADLCAMIRKDISHPSVIMYSIGNEIGDTGKQSGVEISRELVRICHEEDNTRPVVNCINPVVSSMGGSKSKCTSLDEVNPYEETKNSQETASLLANIIVTVVPFIRKIMGKPEKVEKLLRPCFDELDIVGLNYAEDCYEPHHKYDPMRIMVGSETYPHSMAKRWPLIEKNSYLIGDFMWTAIDYLGEAGVGVPIYGTTRGGFNRPYPCVSAGCGVINLLGEMETEGYAANIAWGLYKKPYIAVRPVNHSGEKHFFGMWRDTDAISSWSFKGCEGRRAEIEVYSIGKYIELFQDGVSIGRKELVDTKACFETVYKQGELKAVSYDELGNVIAEETIKTAGKEDVIRVIPEKTELYADGEDVTFVLVKLTDHNGIVKLLEDRIVIVDVTGPAEIIAIGSREPITEERYMGNCFTTSNGTLGFYVRSTGEEGEAIISVSAEGLDTVEIRKIQCCTKRG